jgi:hypothetical protein
VNLYFDKLIESKMGKIACIGWGSLIWNPGTLLIRREWFKDGPILPVEFLRQSKNGRLTLVISEDAKPIQTLWALMATEDLTVAKMSLADREGILDRNIERSIGSVSVGEVLVDKIRMIIQEWIITMNLDAAIWTNLTPKFNDKNGTEPTIDEAVNYLRSLDVNKMGEAEEYIRKAPKQIDTEYRRIFEKELDWTFKE